MKLHGKLREFTANKNNSAESRRNSRQVPICIDKHFILQPLQGLKSESKMYRIRKLVENIDKGENPYQTITTSMSTSSRMKGR